MNVANRALFFGERVRRLAYRPYLLLVQAVLINRPKLGIRIRRRPMGFLYLIPHFCV